ncbi:hypothetical protein LTR10_000576 [Elasticomyces elasticus]|nr:hypothetical protein LTR10_000576 [Elasticomyces elasticus]KAK4980176.1 hypothetical protein LTR42_000483 [Elasticomyces elasticus]
MASPRRISLDYLDFAAFPPNPPPESEHSPPHTSHGIYADLPEPPPAQPVSRPPLPPLILPPPADSQTAGTPLAPSVEKAYYRKCIELKRRLNEVEAANDEAKTKRVRLDRGIMKMRLERAFLLEQLGKRMEGNVDGSEGSGDEVMAAQEPPPERPLRDKRRRPSRPLPPQSHNSHNSHPHTHHHQQQQPLPHLQPHPAQQQGPPQPQQSYPLSALHRLPFNSMHSMVPTPTGEMVPANAVTPEGHLLWLPPNQLAAIPPLHAPPPVVLPSTPGYGPGPQQMQHGSPYGGAPVGVPGATGPRLMSNGGPHGYDGAGDEREGPMRAENGSAMQREEANGERRVVSDGSNTAVQEAEEREVGRVQGGGGGGGFSAINH